MVVFAVSGVYRTVLDPSLGSVFTMVACAAVAGLLMTTSARRWFLPSK